MLKMYKATIPKLLAPAGQMLGYNMGMNIYFKGATMHQHKCTIFRLLDLSAGRRQVKRLNKVYERSQLYSGHKN